MSFVSGIVVGVLMLGGILLIIRGLRMTKKPKTQRVVGRRGLTVQKMAGAGWANKGSEYQCQIELEEIERINKLVRVRYGKVTGISPEYAWRVTELMNEWIPESQIIWLETQEEADARKKVAEAKEGVQSAILEGRYGSN